MRKKLIPTAVLGLALIFTSAAFAEVSTRIDRLDKGLLKGISGVDNWYNWASADNGISNPITGDNVINVLCTGNEKCAELRGIRGSTSDEAQLGFSFKGNKSLDDKYELSKCNSFKFKYKSNVPFKFNLQVMGAGYISVPNAQYHNSNGRPTDNQEYRYLKNFCKSFGTATEWTEVTVNPAEYTRCSDALGSWTDHPDEHLSTTTSEDGRERSAVDSIMHFKWVANPVSGTIGNLKVTDVECISDGLFFMEPGEDVKGKYGQKLSDLNLSAWEDTDGLSWSNENIVLAGTIGAGSDNDIGILEWETQGTGVHNISYFKDVNATYTVGDNHVDGKITVFVEKAEIAKPSAASTVFTYTGAPQGPTIQPVNADYYTISGNSETAAGSYNATVTLNSGAVNAKLLSWNDAGKTTAPFNIQWKINRAKVTKPAIASPTPNIYTGSALTASITPEYSPDTDKYTITGYSATNAGTYNAKVVLKDKENYEWENCESNCTSDFSANWRIEKKAGVISSWPTAAAITFGQTLASSILSGGAADPTGTFRWENTNTPSGEVGDHNYNVEFVPPANQNYDWTGVNFKHSTTITVNKAAAADLNAEDVELKISKSDNTSHAIDLIIPMDPEHGAPGNLTYTPGTLTNAQGVLDGAVTLVNGKITYKGTGTTGAADKFATLPVTIASKNYSDKVVTITFKTVNQDEILVDLEKVYKYTYDGTAKTGYTGTPTATILGGDAYSGTLKYTYIDGNGSSSSSAPINAGYYNLSVDPSDATNYFSNFTHTFEIEKATVETPTGPFTATYGQKLSDVTPAFPSATVAKGTWTWVNATETNVGGVGPQVHLANFQPDDAANYKILTSVEIEITVTKATGATVAAPTVATNGKTANSITIVAVDAPVNEQTVEYGYSTTATGTPTTWQGGLTFNNLTANTTYYIFARAKETANYNAGQKSVALVVKTDNNVGGGTKPTDPPLSSCPKGAICGIGVTPPPATTPVISKLDVSKINVRAIAGTIVLEKLPSNAKVEIYNIQGKRIFSSNAVNSQVLRIQAKTGMHIVKVTLGSETKIMRIAIK